jgi:hypothetical protein
LRWLRWLRWFHSFDRLDPTLLGVPDTESPRKPEFILRNEILALILTHGVDGSGFSQLVQFLTSIEHSGGEWTKPSIGRDRGKT